MRLTGLTLPILLGALLLQVVTEEMTQRLCPESRMPWIPWRACFIKRVSTDCRNYACCNGGHKCCMYKCDRLYKDPEVIKPGECPIPPTPDTLCSMTNMKNGNCTGDQHCYGAQKCCFYNCQYTCKDPAVTKRGKCAKPQVPLSACFPWKPQGGCRSDLECDGAKKCCLYDCQYVCREPVG